jgi:hypothetical protein
MGCLEYMPRLIGGDRFKPRWLNRHNVTRIGENMLFENLGYLWENYRKIVFGFVIFYAAEVLIIVFHQDWMIELIFYTTPLILGVAITTLMIKKYLDASLNFTMVFIVFLTINQGFLTSYMLFELVEHIIGHEEHHDKH